MYVFASLQWGILEGLHYHGAVHITHSHVVRGLLSLRVASSGVLLQRCSSFNCACHKVAFSTSDADFCVLRSRSRLGVAFVLRGHVKRGSTNNDERTRGGNFETSCIREESYRKETMSRNV